MLETAHRLLFAGIILLLIHSSPQWGVGADEKSADAGSHLLRYQFNKGEILSYQVDHESTLVTAHAELEEKVANAVFTRRNHRVVSVDQSGNALMELAIDEARMSAQFDDEKPLSFDSQKPEDCPRHYESIRDIIGKPLSQVRMSPRGEMLEVKPLLPQFKDSISDDPSGSFLVQFPEGPVKVGEGWTNIFKVNVRISRFLTQPVTMQQSYELAEVKDGLATIKLRTGLITPINDAMILGQLIQMAPKGTIVFDIENGRLISRTLTIDKTEVGVIAGGGSMHAKSKREERWIEPPAAPETPNDQ
jgi:hypothetical protein